MCSVSGLGFGDQRWGGSGGRGGDLEDRTGGKVKIFSTDLASTSFCFFSLFFQEREWCMKEKRKHTFHNQRNDNFIYHDKLKEERIVIMCGNSIWLEEIIFLYFLMKMDSCIFFWSVKERLLKMRRKGSPKCQRLMIGEHFWGHVQSGRKNWSEDKEGWLDLMDENIKILTKVFSHFWGES